MKKNNFNTNSEEDFIKNTKKRKSAASQKKKMTPVAKGFAIAGISIGSIIGVFVAVILGLAIYFFTKPLLLDNERGANDVYTDAEGNKIHREQNTNTNTKKYYTFLATATDKAGNLTDVIMVANLTFDEKNPKVSILQIPRDTYVKVSSSKLHFNSEGELSEANFSGSTAGTAIKINEAYYRGKNLAYDTISELLSEVDGKTPAEVTSVCSQYKYKFLHVDVNKVKKYASGDKEDRKEMEDAIRRDFGIFYLEQLIFYNFRIPIDYYAQANINGFRGIVDAIGGVDLTVPEDMDYDDPYQDLHIHLKKGYQHLDGDKAEQFVRYRRYYNGDVGRLDAQKIFMDAFLDKLIKVGPSKITTIMEVIDENLYTSVTFGQLVTLARLVLNMDLSTDVKMHTIPGAGEYVNNISYFLIDKDAACELINSEFNVYSSKILVEDMLITDNGHTYVSASKTKPSYENVKENDKNDDKKTEENETTDESDITDDDDISDDSSEVSEDTHEDESVTDTDGNETDNSDESLNDDKDTESENMEENETDESDDASEDVKTDKSDETNESDTTDKSDDVAKEPEEESAEDSTEEPSEPSIEEPKEKTPVDDEPASSEQVPETSTDEDSSIENDENYALLEQMPDVA